MSSTTRRVGEGYDETFGPGDLFLISRPGLDHGPGAETAFEGAVCWEMFSL
jgi:hypothetical protein